MSRRRRLLFISTRFLFPVDSGGKIRTTQILRGMKEGEYEIVLLSPGSDALAAKYADALDGICHRFVWWPQPARGRFFHYARSFYLLHRLPMPARTDWSRAAAALVRDQLDDRPDVAVFDFVHSAVLLPDDLRIPSVLFTHNVEAEIFARSRDAARNLLLRSLWRSQHRKMWRFERDAVHRFDQLVAVSDRDAERFRLEYGRQHASVIPTGVDLGYFDFRSPLRDRDVVFCGSMDWLPNQEGVSFFMDQVWPLVIRDTPALRMTIVGRAPPAALVNRARNRDLNWTFTGFVDDVRPFVQGAAVFVVPIRVAGGTRLKVYEAMAMGSPVVSTAIGVEGLPVEDGRHFLLADDPAAFARAIVDLVGNSGLRHRIASDARSYVETNCSFRAASAAFEAVCGQAIIAATAPPRP